MTVTMGDSGLCFVVDDGDDNDDDDDDDDDNEVDDEVNVDEVDGDDYDDDEDDDDDCQLVESSKPWKSHARDACRHVVPISAALSAVDV